MNKSIFKLLFKLIWAIGWLILCISAIYTKEVPTHLFRLWVLFALGLILMEEDINE